MSLSNGYFMFYTKLMKYLIGLIALLLPTYLIRFNIGPVPTTLLELLIYAVFIYGLVRLGYCHIVNTHKPVWLPIGLLLISVIIAVYIAPDKLAALGQAKAYFLDPLLVFWLVTVYLEPKDFRWVLYGISLSGLFVGIHTIIQKFIGNVTVDGRVIGIFGYSPNYVALYLAPIMVLIASYGLLIFKKSKILGLTAGIIFLVCGYALYLTGSRSGLLAVLGGLVIFLILYFFSQLKKKMIFKVCLAVLLTIVVLGSWFVFRPDFNASGGRVTSSNNLRWQIWGASLELGRNNPVFGIGLGNYQSAFTNLTTGRVNFDAYIIPQALTPHNLFLMVYLSLGAFGLIAFVWLLIIFYLAGFKNLNQAWAKILIAAMTALLLQGLIDTPYFKNDLSLLFWLIFGFMMLFSKQLQHDIIKKRENKLIRGR